MADKVGRLERVSAENARQKELAAVNPSSKHGHGAGGAEEDGRILTGARVQTVQGEDV